VEAGHRDHIDASTFAEKHVPETLRTLLDQQVNNWSAWCTTIRKWTIPLSCLKGLGDAESGNSFWHRCEVKLRLDSFESFWTIKPANLDDLELKDENDSWEGISCPSTYCT